MKAERLAGLEPAIVYGYFEKLCSIPHGSGNTRQISDYLVSFAREHGLRYIQDSMNNVILFSDGTPGYEDHAPLILQGHMDMVCEKDPDCTIDMAREGLDVTHDDRIVFARGTTLGGDDGIAVAYALALLDSPDAAHPPLEIIITVDEETGMFGAEALDLSMLKSKRLINLDSEDEGIFTVSCAGGARAAIVLPTPRKAFYGPCVRLTVEGLHGGHSGGEINNHYANANKIMGEFLSRVQKLMPLSITALSGGAKDNAIPRSCQATLVALGIDLNRINDVAEALQAEVRAQYNEPEAVIRGDDVEALGGNGLSTEDSAKVIALLCAAPNGVQAMSTQMPGLVQTSLNMGVVTLGEELRMTFSVRSSVDQEKLDLLERLKKLAEFHNGTCQVTGVYPAWEYRENSDLRDKAVETYRTMFGTAPQVVAIHAGLECGLFGKKIQGLDSISFGPQMHDVHTSRERLEIASVQRTWNYLLELLKAL